jgi:hypothetical protein
LDECRENFEFTTFWTRLSFFIGLATVTTAARKATSVDSGEYIYNPKWNEDYRPTPVYDSIGLTLKLDFVIMKFIL